MMDSSDLIYHISPLEKTLRYLFGDRVQSLEEQYTSSTSPEKSYENIVEFLIGKARQAALSGQSICFASYGDAMFMVDSATELYYRSQAEGLSVSLAPGISAIAALRIMFPEELRGNLLCVSADALIEGRATLNARTTTLVTQVAEVTVQELRGEVNRSGIQKLSECISDTYGAEWPCTLAVAPWASGVRAVSLTTSCGKLVEMSEKIHTGMSLLINRRQGM